MSQHIKEKTSLQNFSLSLHLFLTFIHSLSHFFRVHLTTHPCSHPPLFKVHLKSSSPLSIPLFLHKVASLTSSGLKGRKLIQRVRMWIKVLVHYIPISVSSSLQIWNFTLIWNVVCVWNFSFRRFFSQNMHSFFFLVVNMYIIRWALSSLCLFLFFSHSLLSLFYFTLSSLFPSMFVPSLSSFLPLYFEPSLRDIIPPPIPPSQNQ